MQNRLPLALCSLFVLPVAATAQPFPPDKLPPELRPWVDWVRDEVKVLGCVKQQGIDVCVWPGRLELDLGERGGRFSLDATAERPVDLPLPGDLQRWPQEVTVDGAAAPVVPRGDLPALRLAPGRHRISGRFRWSRLPDSLPLPPQVALVQLTLGGRPITRPRREQSGLLWLREQGPAGPGEGESLRLLVFRKLEDGIPVFVETAFSLEVSGKAREVELEGALLEGAVPVAVRGDLPARLDGQGHLHVQVRGGRFSVTVLSRLAGAPTELAPPAVSASPPNVTRAEGEVWVFQADEELRQVELSGPPAIDPSRTELPEDWRSLPAFLLQPDSRLALQEVRRGQPEPPPDQIRLDRELWLDLDGRAFTVRDTFSGALNRTWRLDLQAPGLLGRAAVDAEDQLVTTDPSGGAAGVELRRGQLALQADSRLPRSGALPAVGWAASVEGLSARLHLPPGWSLLAATGVDEPRGTWTSRWTLLGFFFVLLVTFGAQRLVGWRVGLLALVALVLCHREPGAPALVWLSLLGAMALRKVAPQGRLGSLARIWWLASAGVLVIVLVPFAARQLRLALFPQAGTPSMMQVSINGAGPLTGVTLDKAPAEAQYAPAGEALDETYAEEEDRALAPPAPPPPPRPQVMDAEQTARWKGRLSSSREYGYNLALAQEPQAVLQTGPGVPNWQWQTLSLVWSGPVSADHRMRLWLVSPGLNLALTVLRLGLLLLLAATLLIWPRPLRLPRLGRGAAAAALLPLLLLFGRGAAADGLPDRALLDELKTRLTRPAPCEPNCITTASVVMRISDRQLAFAAEVHAVARAAWQVPGPVATWVPSEVRVDGQPSTALVRLDNGFLHLRLEPGVHRVEVSGPTPAVDSLTLQFGDRPRQARAEAPGWEVVGVREDGPADASIQLTRRLRAGSAPRSGEGVYSPWLEVTRTLSLGVSWQVVTDVRRVSPTGAPVAVRVPLLRGESPTDARFEVEEGRVAVSLGRDDVEASWVSTLERTDQLELEAPEGEPWSEVWRLRCGVVWECQAEGLPPTHHQADGVLEPEFHPWPTERLRLTFLHPEAAQGQSLTLEKLTLSSTPGIRLERTTLSLTARTSREGPLALGLPESTEVQEVKVDGEARPSRPAEGRIRLTLPPGSHEVSLTWQRERGMTMAYSMPRVGLPESAANVNLSLELPRDRWLLFVGGPSWGPSVLFWAYLLFLLAAALVMARLPGSPFTGRQWILLGLGLSQIPVAAAAIVAGFFWLLAWRQKAPRQRPLAFDALQLVLGIGAVVTTVLLYLAIQQGLLFHPDMQVAGNGSTDTMLRWYADRVSDQTPAAFVLSAPLWVYRGLMLAWALWLAASLVKWVVWAWRAFTEGGGWKPLGLWKRRAVTVDLASSGPEEPSSDAPKERP